MMAALIEDALLGHPSVRDCAVLEHGPAGDISHTVAYVVPDGPLSSDLLDQHVRAKVPNVSPPEAYVSVSAIPLDDNGNVERTLLEEHPVVDEFLRSRWEAHLAGLSGVNDVAVMIDETQRRSHSVHLAKLIPGWRERLPSNGPTKDNGNGRSPVSTEAKGSRAQSSGGDLQLDPASPKILSDVLVRAAQESGCEKICHLQRDGSFVGETYSELYARAQRISVGLRTAGLQTGNPVLLQLSESFDFLGVFWGIQFAGGVPVPVAVPTSYRDNPGASEKLINAWRQLGQALVVTNRVGEPQLRDVAERKGLSEFRTAVVEDLVSADGEASRHNADPDDVALMLLTSGSTGAPKAVTLSHRTLIARTAAAQLVNSLSGDDVTLNWMPLDHVVGLVMFHIRDVWLGCQQLHVATDRVIQEPTLWLDWIEQFRVTVTFAPNFAYALINDLSEEIAQRKWDLSSLRFAMNAGESIVSATARRFLQVLEPHGLVPTAMLPCWGMSETSSAVTFNRAFSLNTTSDDDMFVDIGPPIPGFDMRIVDGDDQLVNEGVVGSLQVRGPTVTKAYYNNPKANAESFTPDGWFRTGDLGFLQDGSLTMTGRAKDVIIVNGINYYSHEIEKVVEELDGVVPSFTAACAVRAHGVDTDQLVIFFHSEVTDDWSLVRLIREIRQTVARQIGLTPQHLIPVDAETIPKTGIRKIQRSLLRKQFDSGQFDDALRKVECLLGGPDTIPAWFHRPVWVRRAAAARTQNDGDYLILTDSVGLGEKLRSNLQERGLRVVCAKPGERFQELEKGVFQIKPEDSSDFDRLMECTTAQGLNIRNLIHLWTYEPESCIASDAESVDSCQRFGSYALINLARAVTSANPNEEACRLLVATRRTQNVVNGECAAFCHAAVPAVVRTMSQEMQWLESVTVDLFGDDVAEDASHVISEFDAHWTDEEAAYRNGHRFVRRIERLSDASFGATDARFVRGGTYLLTGGLGGIGREIAAYLLREYHARLLLVGRRELPLDTAEPDTESDHHERLRALESLRELPGEVEYRAVDVADGDALHDAVAAMEQQWGSPLAGVIHLAGTFQERLLQDESLESFAAACRPKIQGSLNLRDMLRNRPGTLFLAFSSVNGFFGGYGAGSYSAANAFLEGVVQSLINQDGIAACSLAWSLWDEVGMSRGYKLKESARRRGYHVIDLAKGLYSFLGSIHSGEGHLLIGLDDENPRIRPLLVPARPPVNRIVAYLAPRDAALVSQSARMGDRLHTPTDCEVRLVPSIQRTPTGEVDWAALTGGEDSHGQDHVAPSTDAERVIAEAWKKVLGVGAIGVHENFFDLGASSLLIARAQLEIQNAVESEVALAMLYEYPTVHLLADHVANADNGGTATPEVEESALRGGRRRERMKRRKRRSVQARETLRDQDSRDR